ncbi:MAG: type II toxin-antitoxin system PemK/MazF family toxin [Proteobacteria bacterium]|nr:type II toxin-antitoxin system PemK/MazF family toxin [Pseudomonadota bacterium]
MRRGDVCWYAFQPPDKRRPVLILTRDSAIRVLNSVTVAPITTTVRDIPSEVLLSEADGLPTTCAANFDNVQTVAKGKVGERIAHLSSRRMREAAQALAFALALDE